MTITIASGTVTGLARPKGHAYKDIAALAVESLSKLDANFLIHDTSTGQIDANHALQLVEDVSGVTANPSVAGLSYQRCF